MRKLALIMAFVVMGACVLTACGSNNTAAETTAAASEETKDETVAETAAETAAETEAEDASEEVPEVAPVITGGWTVNANLSAAPLPEGAQEAFDTAMSAMVGVGYTPIALLGTQVVAGTNYMYLCKGTTVTQTPVDSIYLVVVYADLSGNAEVTKSVEIDIDAFELYGANETQDDVPLAGGWTLNENYQAANIDADAAEVFSEAAGEEGYDVLALLGSQVVSGIRYAYLAQDADGVAVIYATKAADGTVEPASVLVLSLMKLADAE